MRILVTIPHYFREVSANPTNQSNRVGARPLREAALVNTVSGLWQLFGRSIYGLDHHARVAWQVAHPDRHELDIVLCTVGDDHLLAGLPELAGMYRRHSANIDPLRLGFECHRLIQDAGDGYDFYVYLEDDIVCSDPMLFRKRVLFDRAFDAMALLQPQRYEIAVSEPVHKLYCDYRIDPAATAAYQDIFEEPLLSMPFCGEALQFERSSYPSAGCFILNAEQRQIWLESPAFLDGDESYMSPLDSAATLSIMKTFRVYKPVLDHSWFFELRHFSPRWLDTVGYEARIAPRAQPLQPVPRA